MQTSVGWLRFCVVIAALLAQSCAGHDACAVLVRSLGPPDGINETVSADRRIRARTVTYQKVGLGFTFLFSDSSWHATAQPPYNWDLVKIYDLETRQEVSREFASARFRRQLHLQ